MMSLLSNISAMHAMQSANLAPVIYENVNFAAAF